MARTAVVPQSITRAGTTPTYAAPNASGNGGNSFVNDGQTILHVKNASAGPITVTIQVPNTVDGLAVASRTVSVPATTGDMLIGPFPAGVYNQPDGSVYYDCGASATSITQAVLRLSI
jgi:hypothetical protein